MKLLIIMFTTLLQFSAFAQDKVVIQNTKVTVFGTEFSSNVLESHFQEKNSLGISLLSLKLKVGDTAEGLKAEVKSSVIWINALGPKVNYITEGNKITVNVSYLKLGYKNNQEITVTRIFELNDSGTLVQTNEFRTTAAYNKDI